MTGKRSTSNPLRVAITHLLLPTRVTSTGHNMKWDQFDILARGRSDTHCKIKAGDSEENVTMLFLLGANFPTMTFVSLISYLLYI